ncbi:hypothetical protein FKM82_017600 [Ascaphus truei]
MFVPYEKQQKHGNSSSSRYRGAYLVSSAILLVTVQRWKTPYSLFKGRSLTEQHLVNMDHNVLLPAHGGIEVTCLDEQTDKV